MRNVFSKTSLKNRRAVSQVMGSIVILGIVTSVGSVILFNGMESISAFTYDLSFHEKSKNQLHREDIIFEYVRFVPNSDNLEIVEPSKSDKFDYYQEVLQERFTERGKEIAEELNVGIGTIKQAVFRAVKKLRISMANRRSA